jgi:hypothetical protein
MFGLLAVSIFFLAQPADAEERKRVWLSLSGQALKAQSGQYLYLQSPYTFQPHLPRDPFTVRFFRRMRWRLARFYKDTAFTERFLFRDLKDQAPLFRYMLRPKYRNRGKLPEGKSEQDMPSYYLELIRVEDWLFRQDSLRRRDPIAMGLRLRDFSRPDWEGITMYFRPGRTWIPDRKLIHQYDYQGIEELKAATILEQELFNFQVLRWEQTEPLPDFAGHVAALNERRGREQLLQPSLPVSKRDVAFQVPFNLAQDSALRRHAARSQAPMSINRRLKEQVVPELFRQILTGETPLYYHNDQWEQIPPKTTRDLVARHPATETRVTDETVRQQDFSHAVSSISLTGRLVKTEEGVHFEPAYASLSWHNPGAKMEYQDIGRIKAEVLAELQSPMGGGSVLDLLASRQPFNFYFRINGAVPQRFPEAFIVGYYLDRGQWAALPSAYKLRNMEATELQAWLKRLY